MTSRSTSLFVVNFFPTKSLDLHCEFFLATHGNSPPGYLQKKRSHARHGPKLGELEARGQASSTGDMEDFASRLSSRLM